MQEVFKISNLEQVRLLSDPFKLSILQAFAEGERTTKDVAKALDQPITKLYRHVDALHAAGLLAITREKQKRGTVERYFEAAGRRFEADHSLFAGDAGGEDDSIRDMLRAGEDEIVGALRAAEENGKDEPLVVRLRIKASPGRLKELQEQLESWVESVEQQGDDDDSTDDHVEAGAMVAFYPIKDDR